MIFPGVGLVLVIIFIFILMLIIKCCLDSRHTTKVTRRRHRGNSFQDIYRGLHESFSARAQNQTHTATAPLQQARITDVTNTLNDLGVDDIIVIPEPNEASPVVVPPYPVEPRHPTPHVAPPGPGFATHNPPYPTQTPHPMPGAAPYPPAVGPTPYPPVITGATPYPPAGPQLGGTAPYPDFGAQPPSYSEAVSQPPVQPLPSKEGYSKQAPYNPNY